MRRRAKRCALAAALLMGLGLPAAAAEEAAKPADAEFGGECVMGLAFGKDIKTDCSVSTVYDGKTYCFGNDTAKQLFLKKPGEFLLKAHVYHSSRQPKQGQ